MLRHSTLSTAVLFGTLLVLSGLAVQSQPIGAALPNEMKIWPITVSGHPSAKDKVVFLWSRACDDCLKDFQRCVGPLLTGPAKGRIYLMLLQYETSRSGIDEILTVTCSGNRVYTWATLNYLFHGANEKSAREKEPEDVRSSRAKLCNNKAAARQSVVAYMERVKHHYKPDRVPAIFLNGHQITDPAELAALNK